MFDTILTGVGGLAGVWIQVTTLVCLFIIIAFRPDRIFRPRCLWRACLLFALSLIIPSLFALFLPDLNQKGPFFPSLSFFFRIGAVISVASLSLSILFMLYALFPWTGPYELWPFREEVRVTARPQDEETQNK